MTVKTDVITPEKILFSAQADMVSVPGAEGDFGVLPGHAPFISTLRPGVIEIDRAGEGKLRIAVTEGVAEVTPDSCTILAGVARSLEGLSAADAREEEKAAEEAVKAALTAEQTTAAEKRLLIAKTVASAF